MLYPKIDSLYKRDTKGNHLVGQYAKPEFEYLKDNLWNWTEKVDGTNIRIEFDGESKRVIKGRSDNAQILPHLLQYLDELAVGIDFEGEFTSPTILYGEGYGMKINGGGKYIPDGVSFILFDVNIGGHWLSRDNVVDVATKLGLDVVPLVMTGTIDAALRRVAIGFESKWPGVQPEGLVGRTVIPLYNKEGNRVTVKLKTRDMFPVSVYR